MVWLIIIKYIIDFSRFLQVTYGKDLKIWKDNAIDVILKYKRYEVFNQGKVKA